MARSARHKSTEAAFYHLTNRVAGRSDWFPFKNDQARHKLLDMMLFYVNAYRCRLAAFHGTGRKREGDSLFSARTEGTGQTT